MQTLSRLVVLDGIPRVEERQQNRLRIQLASMVAASSALLDGHVALTEDSRIGVCLGFRSA